MLKRFLIPLIAGLTILPLEAGAWVGYHGGGFVRGPRGGTAAWHKFRPGFQAGFPIGIPTWRAPAQSHDARLVADRSRTGVFHPRSWSSRRLR